LEKGEGVKQIAVGLDGQGGSMISKSAAVNIQ